MGFSKGCAHAFIFPIKGLYSKIMEDGITKYYIDNSTLVWAQNILNFHSQELPWGKFK